MLKIFKHLDPTALDLMAYLRNDATICPVCSGSKANYVMLCHFCFQHLGPKESKIKIQEIEMEIGCRNTLLWENFTGKNLSLFFGKESAVHPKKLSVLPISKTEEREGTRKMTVPSKNPNRSISKEKIVSGLNLVFAFMQRSYSDWANEQPTAPEKELLDNFLASNFGLPGFDSSDPLSFDASFKKLLILAEFKTNRPKKTVVLPAETFSETAKKKTEIRIISKPPERKMIVISQKRQATILESLSNEKIEILPGFSFFDDVLELMANGAVHERIFCPICKEQKNSNYWLCDKCYHETNSPEYQFLIQWEISQREPYANFIEGNLLSPKMEAHLVSRLVVFLRSDFGSEFLGHPRSLIKIAKALPEIPGHKKPIAYFVLAKIALEAITEVQLNGTSTEQISNLT